MSLPRSETVECPTCGQPQDVSVWASVNVTIDPDLKREVLDGSVAHFKCRACRHSIKIEGDLLYHDMTKRLAVWLKYPDEDGFVGVDPAAAAVAEVLGEAYVRRVVASYEELVEKIKIADAGLDDREIEMFKLLVCIREQIDIAAPFVFVNLKKSLLGRISAVFQCAEQGRSRDRTYPVQNIQSTIAEIRPRLRQLPQDDEAWPYVNRDYSLKRLSDAGLISPVDGQTVTVHILDPQAGLGQAFGLAEEELQELGMSKAVETYRVEEWTVGKEISAEQYSDFHDPGTRDLYILLVYEAGRPSTHVVRRDIWIQARTAMGA